MAKREIFICLAFAALVLTNEIDDPEQKKRGAGKANALNAIPTGAQKPEYTYNIYPQNPIQSPNPVYQNQVPNTFYPNQQSQYNTETQHQTAAPQTSQFVPINFVANSGYQQKYIVQPKPGNVVTVLQPNQFHGSILQYPQSMLAHPSNQIAQHASIFNTPHGQFNFPQYSLPQFGNPFIHPSMLVIPPISQYANLLTNQPQAIYFQPQVKPNHSTQPSQAVPNDYEKFNSHQIATPKEESEHRTDYISSDSNNVFKNTYNTARTAYTKI